VGVGPDVKKRQDRNRECRGGGKTSHQYSPLIRKGKKKNELPREIGESSKVGVEGKTHRPPRKGWGEVKPVVAKPKFRGGPSRKP